MPFYKISEKKYIPWEMGCCYDDKTPGDGGRTAHRDDLFVILSADKQYNLLYNITKNYTIHKENNIFTYCFVEV
ncbi:MAG: hypothetical protein AABY22_11670 [Nanoarchaeota archaeon]